LTTYKLPSITPHSSLAQPDSVVELRQYRLHPGVRDTLIDLFDREFVETQEAVGMRVIQLRDLDDPDRFVWLRGFRDMRTRAKALQAFYDGPVWQEHRDAANATMIDSNDVLLLRPARPGSGFRVDTSTHPPVGASQPGGPRRGRS
jgi:NIPSNAP